MAMYIIKRQRIKLKVNKLKPSKIYTLKPNIKNTKMISINSLNIASQKYVDVLLAKKLEKSFREIMTLYLQAIDSDDCSGIIIVLNEIEKLKQIILLKYQKNISKELYLKYLKRLTLFEKNLKEKLNILQMTEELIWNNTKSR